MIDGALPYLRCPVCGAPLHRAGTAVRCDRAHSYDIARQGYLTLTAGRNPHPGDSAEMVADRVEFLAAGHYDFVTDAVRQAVRAAAAPDLGLVLDAGTGTGHHLAGVLDVLPAATGLGLDVSKPALRRAARVHPRAGAVLADLWRPWPVADDAAGVLLNVFAPRNGGEFHRVLRPDGVLVVVTPAPDHLTELVEGFGLVRVDPDKAGRVAGALGDRFTVTDRVTHRRRLRLGGAEIRTLIGMTPSARHREPRQVPAVEVPDATVTAAVDVTVHRPVPDRAVHRPV